MSDALWVFGYGSLIWDPGFPVAEAKIATIHDWRRSFCMWSVHYRGSAAAPGLVLALDHAPGAACQGVAFRVTPGAETETLAALRARELISDAYQERRLGVHPQDGPPVEALTYVIDRDHGQYCGGLDLEAQAQILARAAGVRGPNCDYLWSTTTHLRDLGIADPDMEWLSLRVRDLLER
jgi:glutathione-specific gamma-glutamylcyclotransferase